MTTGMTYQLLHSPLTARNSCIVSFQWLFTVLKDKKWCSTHSKFIAFTSSGLTGSIVVRQPSRRRCPEEWLHLNLCYSRDLRSVPRHWYDQYDKGGARRGGKVLLPDDGDINSLIGNTTHSRWWPPPSWWKKDNCFDSPGRGPLRIFKDLSDYTVPRLRLAIIPLMTQHAKCGRGNQWEGLLDGTEDDGRESMVEHCSVLGHKWLSTSLATHRYRLIMIPFRPAFMTAPSSPTPFTPTTPPATNII